MAINVRPSVRARDLRANIRELGFETGVVATMEALLEEHSEIKAQMRALVSLTNQLIEGYTHIVHASAKLKEGIDELTRISKQGDA